MKRTASLVLASVALWAAPTFAQPVVVDRAVVRFIAPETGGPRAPRFVFERMLAFEARLEALSDPDHAVTPERPYRERHVRAALERHVAETLLAALSIDPEPTAAEVARVSEAARRILYQRVGGVAAIERAQAAEGIADRELILLLRRQARASLYLDRMVAPMLQPTNAELLALHRTTNNPYAELPFDKARAPLQRWYVAQRLSEALASFFQNARSRVELTVLE